jgi:hypothetical protein
VGETRLQRRKSELRGQSIAAFPFISGFAIDSIGIIKHARYGSFIIVNIDNCCMDSLISLKMSSDSFTHPTHAIPSVDFPFAFLSSSQLRQTQGTNITLSMKITVKTSPFVRVCGYLHKNSLRSATFFLDPNIANPDPDYKMSANAYQIKTRKYVQDECTQLNELPVGQHVLTVMSHPSDKVYVSHLILFE